MNKMMVRNSNLLKLPYNLKQLNRRCQEIIRALSSNFEKRHRGGQNWEKMINLMTKLGKIINTKHNWEQNLL